MLRHKPQFSYCGLTVIISNKSRFDDRKLLSAGGGRLFDEFLRPQFNRYQCDIRLKEDFEPFLPNTKCILLLGESATKLWLTNTENTLGEIRGSVYSYNGRFTSQSCEIPIIPSFFPQDAADPKNFEKDFNAQEDIEIEEAGPEDYEDTKRRHGRTARRNYRFWLGVDIEKVKQIIHNNGQIPKRLFEPDYRIFPSSEEVIEVLNTQKGKDIFIDLETWYPSCDLQCFSFSFGVGCPIYCVPTFLHDITPAYYNLHHIFKSLAVALRDNCAVAHNGHNFDFIVLPWKYKIPLGRRMKDTMVMMHRCFSDVEKSLGHMTSWATFEPFHKDEGQQGYMTREQVTKKLTYCGKDVYTMMLCYYHMVEYAKKIPGLEASFNMANDAIYPYVLTMLHGIRFKDELRQEVLVENDRLMNQYIRMLNLLLGEDNVNTIRGKSKTTLLGSPSQCTKYFHEILGYPVVARGAVTSKGVRNASLAKKNIFKLKLKHDNPIIDLVIAYRETQTESGYLKFTEWVLKKDEPKTN